MPSNRTVSRFISITTGSIWFSREQTAQGSPDRAVPHDDDAVARRFPRRHDRRGAIGFPRVCRRRRVEESPQDGFERINEPVENRVERDGSDRRGDEGVGRPVVEEAEALAGGARMKENSPIWASATATEIATRSGY